MNDKHQLHPGRATDHPAREDKLHSESQTRARTDGQGKADEKMMPDAHHGGRQDAPQGEPVIGEKTVWWALAGLLIGLFIGWMTGLAFGYGRLNVPGLAPLVAGGADVSGLIFACFFGALFGLAGALLGTASDTREGAQEHQSGAGHQGMKHDKQPFIQQLPIYGSIALALLMAWTLYVIASRGIGFGKPSDQSNRVTWNQKNAARVGGASDAETIPLILQTAFPATRRENRPGVIIIVGDDWHAALAATPLIARPINAALVQSTADAGLQREAERLRAPVALPQAAPSPAPAGTTTLESTPTQAAPAFPATEQLTGTDPSIIAAGVDERLATVAGNQSENVMVVSADADYRWALPAGSYAARTETPVLFVTKDGVPPATDAALKRRGGRARIFVLGPNDAVSAGVFDQLKQFGAVTRIEGDNYFENAVRFAEFRDEAAGFGWGHSGQRARQWATVNSILVSGDRWQDGVFASHLARAGKSGPLLFIERDRLPAVVDNHLWRQRPAFSNTPAEGPFNHVWVVGGFDRIAYGPQAWADYSQEIEQYMTLGDSAVSGFEALGLGWVIFSIASAIWILFHSIKRLPGVMPMMKAAWTIFALLFGPLAVWFYVKSYHRREKMEHDGMMMWQRPMWAQVVSATVMMFAFDMMLMVLAVFIIASFGFPIIRFNSPIYWLGSSMFLMMVLMYVIALVVMMLVFHTPMTMHEQKINSYGKAFLVGLPIMLATMTVESLGMMPTMWWAQMLYLPAMQMPTGDDFTMWVTLLMSVFVGFLVVLPFNYRMVKRGAKMGTM